MMANKDSLGDRMKCYENVTRNYLTRRAPVIIRVDGKAFHSFTRGFKRPFDGIFVKSMQETMKYLCENIQGCVLGYTQSDEITLVIIDYEKIESCAWFDNNIQKMASISASMATLAFNKYFSANVYKYIEDYKKEHQLIFIEEDNKYYNTLIDAIKKGAMFDSRVFTLPKEEVVNCVIWRQQDATRNSINSVGQANFSHKQLQNKSCNDVQDMLMSEKGINWNDYTTTLKRGSCCIKMPQKINDGTKQEYIRNKWIIDNEIPIFTQDREYINSRIFV
jgi:tRNA(His) 5'-end guanylyltransferase